MDKLELDARMTRLERRHGLVLALLLVVQAAVLALLIGFPRFGRVEPSMRSTVIAAPLPPSTQPAEWITTEMASDMGVASMMSGMARSDSMTVHYRELATLKQLQGEGVISEAEWQAKKEQVLSRQLNPEDLRTDLEMVRKLVDAGALTEGEQASLRTRLLGLEEPKA
ncbi:hypothetical protein [Tautonia plasticadhaerens]|uniref:SHOCT domain-containing protein n=1 Tax=Tautonia plasticadhaerens TaxID=2527974 RepID=A0A518H682_9BACT|nr:hypothetical protein [Tautonia plasticadhaerens]QDV36345.1 hypothetical protein ElP_42650 [Tautonia plasticadhaerens]